MIGRRFVGTRPAAKICCLFGFRVRCIQQRHLTSRAAGDSVALPGVSRRRLPMHCRSVIARCGWHWFRRCRSVSGKWQKVYRVGRYFRGFARIFMQSARCSCFWKDAAKSHYVWNLKFVCSYYYIPKYILPRDVMLARYMLSSYVCLSVRPSVTRRYCTQNG